MDKDKIYLAHKDAEKLAGVVSIVLGSVYFISECKENLKNKEQTIDKMLFLTKTAIISIPIIYFASQVTVSLNAYIACKCELKDYYCTEAINEPFQFMKQLSGLITEAD